MGINNILQLLLHWIYVEKIVFIFNEDEIRENRKREICIGLQESLMKLIYDEDTITRGQDIIHKELPKPKIYSSDSGRNTAGFNEVSWRYK